MKLLRSIALTSACLLALSFSTLTQAQGSYPDKPISIWIGFPPGTSTDSVGRILADKMSKDLGQPIIIKNKPGVGGTLAPAEVAKSQPDGYTLLLATSSTNVANPYLYKKVGFDPIKDFTPVASVAMLSSVLVVPTSSPFKSPKDIIAAAQAAPGTLLYGSGGVGASAHLAGELFNSVSKIDITHVPYKGSGPALTDVMGGQINMMFDTGAFPHIKGGKIRALAVAAEKRHPLIPDVPTFEELGIKGMIMNAWYGVAAPAGTPAAVVAKVNQAVEHALKSGELSKRLTDIGAEVRGGTPEAFATFWRNELVRYEKLVKLTGASLD